ncbi:glutaredoxin 3 [Gammaproteobacteria bacterium 45_16_T64]|nr:glutaredoxin 3 [Gammaproteobacteria bacterium 45_16_T64]
MKAVTLYTTPWCPYCVRAKHLLASKGVEFEDKDVSRAPALKKEMVKRSGRQTVPQIWIGTEHIGGCDELYALERSGRLEPMLTATSA